MSEPVGCCVSWNEVGLLVCLLTRNLVVAITLLMRFTTTRWRRPMVRKRRKIFARELNRSNKANRGGVSTSATVSPKRSGGKKQNSQPQDRQANQAEVLRIAT